ncbi:four helix bundle protein [Microcoleus sp. Pol12A5]|jgi:four helix bundle protein|uniref:four helix bundle protein n=1 Tax=Microcoleus sp. Pol12A5 TaxID=3055392 RepID=UPI002FD7708A
MFGNQLFKGSHLESFQQLRVDRLAEKISNEIWLIIKKWDDFAKDTMGKQIVRSADGVGSNLAEGHGRCSYQNNQRFVKIALGFIKRTKTLVET